MREGFTLFALGEDGQVYKSLPDRSNAQHRGWLLMSDKILTEVKDGFRPPKPHVGLAVGEKVRIFDNALQFFGYPPIGVITEVVDEGGYRMYDVAWPAGESDQKVSRLYERQVERYVEPPPAPVNPTELLPDLPGKPELVALCEEPVAAPEAMCPKGCRHPVSVHHSSGGCLAHIAKADGTLTETAYEYCPCDYTLDANPVVPEAAAVEPLAASEGAAVEVPAAAPIAEDDIAF